MQRTATDYTQETTSAISRRLIPLGLLSPTPALFRGFQLTYLNQKFCHTDNKADRDDMKTDNLEGTNGGDGPDAGTASFGSCKAANKVATSPSKDSRLPLEHHASLLVSACNFPSIIQRPLALNISSLIRQRGGSSQIDTNTTHSTSLSSLDTVDLSSLLLDQVDWMSLSRLVESNITQMDIIRMTRKLNLNDSGSTASSSSSLGASTILEGEEDEDDAKGTIATHKILEIDVPPSSMLGDSASSLGASSSIPSWSFVCLADSMEIDRDECSADDSSIPSWSFVLVGSAMEEDQDDICVI